MPMTPRKGPRWLDYVPVDDLPDDPVNPKSHADADLDASLARFGYTEPVMLDERTGLLISGHGRKAMVQRARDRQLDEGEERVVPDGVVVDKAGAWLVPVTRGWSSVDDEDARAYLVAANHLTEKGGWHQDPLAELLSELSNGRGFDGTGFTATYLDDLLSQVHPPEDPPDPRGSPEDAGAVLSLVSVAVGDPEHTVNHRELWQVGPHLLAVADVMTEHELWSPHLPGRLFLPYPGLYVLHSSRLDERPALAVQPDRYLAGHVLDKYESIYGDGTVTLVGAL